MEIFFSTDIKENLLLNIWLHSVNIPYLLRKASSHLAKRKARPGHFESKKGYYF
jgi:hypothetical protein